MKKLYSKGEEIFNGVSHIVGGGLGVLFLVFSVIYSSMCLTLYELLTLILYSVSIICLYTMSSLYHSISNEKAKRVLRVFDHCTIFFLIAGTYTPFMLIGMPCIESKIILIGVWICTVIGIALNAINMNSKFVKVISYILYILMGWSVTLIADKFSLMNTISFILLLVGGIIYTFGFVFYVLGKKYKWFHSIWHLFVLGGTICHFISVIFLIV